MERMVTLSEYCSSVRDGTHDSPKQVSDGKFLITSRHINNNEIDFSNAYKISETDFIKVNKRSKVDKWDLLMSMIGTVGRLYIVKEEPNYAIKNLALFKIGDEWRAKYLYYYLGSKPVQDYFEAVANGTSQHFVGLGYLRNFKVPDWNDNTLKIIKILNNYDQLIENNNKRIKILEDMAESLYKEWFVRFRFPGHETAEFENGIPKGWEYKKFSEVCSYIRGLSYSSEEIEDENAPNLLINLKNLRDYGGFRKENYKRYDGSFKKEQIVSKFDLVMAVTEMVQERRIIGYVGLIPSYQENCVISADLIKLISDIDNLFLYSMFIYGGASLSFSQYGNGTNVIHLKPNSLKNVKLLIPNKNLIDNYSKIVRSYFEEIDKLQLQNEILVKERDALLPRLMSGIIDVEKMNNHDTQCVVKVVSFPQFRQMFEMKSAARAKEISEEDIKAAYEVYVNDKNKKNRN